MVANLGCMKTRRQILKKNFPPQFTKKSEELYIENTNCYGYVFDMHIVSDSDPRFSYLGWTRYKEILHYTKESAEKAMISDVQNLGFKIKKLKKCSKPKKNRINFAFFLNRYTEGDFHFVRQNEDGSWSEKCGYGGGIRYFRNKNNKTCLPHENDLDEIEFVGYFQAHIK